MCSFCCHLSRLGHSSNEKRICSVCESAFCPGCLNFWRGKRGADCRDQKCKFIRDLLEGTPQSLKFHLFKKDTREQEVIRVPRIRACPRCGLLIETRVASDKRARCVCVNMGYSFCLVCLSLVDGSGRSDCGAFYEVCSPKSKGEA